MIPLILGYVGLKTASKLMEQQGKNEVKRYELRAMQNNIVTQDDEVERQRAESLAYNRAHYYKRGGADEGTYYEMYPGQIWPSWCRNLPCLHYMRLVPFSKSKEERLLCNLDSAIAKRKREALPWEQGIVEKFEEMQTWPADFWITYEAEFAKVLATGKVKKMVAWFWNLAQEYLSRAPQAA